METDENFKIKYLSKRLFLSWKAECKDPLFDFSFQVLWRGITFPVKIRTVKDKLGFYSEITIRYDGNKYVGKFIWRKTGTGRFGDVLPEIRNTTHTLKFRNSRGYMEMTESPLDPSYRDSDEISPFTLFLLIKQNHERLPDDIEIRNC